MYDRAFFMRRVVSISLSLKTAGYKIESTYQLSIIVEVTFSTNKFYNFYTILVQTCTANFLNSANRYKSPLDLNVGFFYPNLPA